MAEWDSYPTTYRATEVRQILAAVRAGECVSIIGLSGAGKSNLLRFLAEQSSVEGPHFVLLDCNRLPEQSPTALFRLARRQLGDRDVADDELSALDVTIESWMAEQGRPLCFLIDRLDELAAQPGGSCLSNLRALRDAYKYRLTFVTATRRPLPVENEFAELVLANRIWLGPLAESDARWTVARYTARKRLSWDEASIGRLIELSRGYPSLLRAACEAHAAGASPEELPRHPAVRARIEEFWLDGPGTRELRAARLIDHPLLGQQAAPFPKVESTQLTAKEHRLLEYFLAHPNAVCDKEELIRAVWPEDQIYEEGVRDSSLAQLVRRLRQKIEPDPSEPRFIQTVPGRGYLFDKA